MKKVAVVGTVGLPACYGGFESLVENLTLNTSENLEYEVFCSSRSYKDRVKIHNNAKLTYIPLNANGLQSVPYDILSMLKCCFSRPDTILILGVSGCLFLPILKRLVKSRIVTNIDGLEWKRDKWGRFAKAFLKYSESLAVKYSDVVITDNEAITNYVLSEYGIKSQTISYGGDHAVKNFGKIKHNSKGYALGLCRIEPENNVDLILRAMSETDCHLKFVGNWESSSFGRNLREQYKNADNIELLDPIYDLEALYELRSNCSLYLHGHSAGGTNPSLVEMMHFGVPIIAYDCDFNRYSTNNAAVYFRNEDELKNLVTGKLWDSNQGLVMRKIALENYTWKVITKKYEDSY